jgi:hypothetical protein
MRSTQRAGRGLVRGGRPLIAQPLGNEHKGAIEANLARTSSCHQKPPSLHQYLQGRWELELALTLATYEYNKPQRHAFQKNVGNRTVRKG